MAELVDAEKVKEEGIETKECRPVGNPAWRKATDKEVEDWLTKAKESE